MFGFQILCCSWTCYLIVAVTIYIGYKMFKKIQLKRKLDRWSNTPKDIVVLHGVGRSFHVPSTSPFVLKVETFLRMASIPYKHDSKDSLGPRGKTPWITLNGEHISDSQLIMKYLSKKFGVNLNLNYNDDKLAIGTLVRVMLEEHLYWGIGRWVFVEEGRHTLSKKMRLPAPKWLYPFIFPMIRNNFKRRMMAQGMGLHTKEEVYDFMIQDLLVVSNILGTNKFLLGDEPCEDDAAFFGFAAQLMWGLAVDSKEAKFMHAELHNVSEYCHRMKERYWPDWETCLAKKSD